MDQLRMHLETMKLQVSILQDSMKTEQAAGRCDKTLRSSRF